MKTLKHHAPVVHRNTLIIATLGALSFAAQIACSDEAPPRQMFPGAAGTLNNSAGSLAAVGGSAGTFGTTAGTGFGAGSDAGGTAGTATGGTGGATGGTGGTDAAGTGGTGVIVIPPLECTAANSKALPIPLTATWSFPDSGDDSFSETTLSGGAPACTAAGLASDAPDCWSMAWTPVTRTFVHWYWHNMGANWTGQGVCVAAGAKAITLKAKGDSAFKATFAAGGVEAKVDLTTEWQDVVINIEGLSYNTRNAAGGVNEGFVVVLPREAADTAAREVYFYGIKWVAELPVGGEGGSGAGGDSGTGGAP